MSPRIGFIWRLVLILLAALIAIQLLAAAVFFIERERATATGFRLPLPDQIAGLAALLDHATPEATAAALRAVNGPGFLVQVLADRPAESAGARHLVAVEKSLARYLEPGEGRYLSAILLDPEEVSGFARVGAWFERRARVVVSLASGGYLVVETGAGLALRVLGLPPGFWVGILGFLVAILAVLAVMREARPLAALAGSLERFGQALEPSPIAERGAPEMRALIRAVNAMQARIASLVKGRTFMLGALSHDLRTYLTRLQLRVDALPEGEARERMSRDLEDMQALVEEALAFARDSFLDPKHEPLDLGPLLEQACGAERAQGRAVRFHGAAVPIRVSGAAAPLGRVFSNLIDNAVKYGGEAEVSLTIAAGQAEIRVEDRGPGIPVAEREAVFEPFRRLDGSRNRELGGAGLGLAIARQIVEAHGGRIAVEDRAGGGASFRIRLPRLA